METLQGLISHVLQCPDPYGRVHVSVSLTPLHQFSALRHAVVSFFQVTQLMLNDKNPKRPCPSAEGEPVWSHQTYKDF